MRLRATLAHRYWLDKPLCELSNVLESYAWSKPNFVQRRIEAKLHSVTEFWAPFFQEWMRMRQSPLVIEGQSFHAVWELQVNYDLYGSQSWIQVLDDSIQLILLERFEGVLSDFPKRIMDRNRHIENRLQRWKDGNITRNYLRKLRGLPPIESPFMNARLDKNVLEEMKCLFLGDPVKGLALRTNLIC